MYIMDTEIETYFKSIVKYKVHWEDNEVHYVLREYCSVDYEPSEEQCT